MKTGETKGTLVYSVGFLFEAENVNLPVSLARAIKHPGNTICEWISSGPKRPRPCF